MWVHGNNAAIQLNELGRDGMDPEGIPWTSLIGLRKGWGVTYRCQGTAPPGLGYWFHFAIPTPVIKDGVRAKFRRAFVLYSTDQGVTLSSVHVYDGASRIYARDGLAVGGDHSGLPLETDINAFDLPGQEVFFGVGISAYFYFASDANVTLNSAGIDFDI